MTRATQLYKYMYMFMTYVCIFKCSIIKKKYVNIYIADTILIVLHNTY